MIKRKLKGRKSYFYKSLVNFMLTLCVPILAILLIFIQAEQTVKEQIQVSNQSNLNQFFHLVDSIASEMKEVCISVTGSEECQNYAYYANKNQKKAPYQTLVVSQMLNNFLRERYHDVFVYFPAEDRIISGANASLNTDFYYDTYYAKPKSEMDFREEFKEILECESKRPAFFVMNRNSTDYYLCAAMKQTNYKEPELSYVVVVVLEPGFINQLIDKEDTDTGSIIMMFNQDREMLLSNDPALQSWHLEGYAGNEMPYEMEQAGKNYMIQVQESDVLNGYYASAIPFEYFWRQLYKMRVICGISIVICIVLSILVAYRNTLRTYEPVHNVVARLRRQTGSDDYNGSECTEFEFITSLFEKQKEEWENLKRKHKNSENLHRNEVLMALLEEHAEGKMEEDFFEKNGITLCSRRFMVGILQVKEDHELEILPFIVQNVFEELFNREHKGYVLHHSQNRYAVLINPDETAAKEELEALLQDGKFFLQKYYHLDMTIAVSDIHEEMEEIPVAYKEAVKALRYEYLLGNSSIIEYQRIESRRFQYLSTTESRLFQMLIKYMKEGDSRKAPEIFAEEIMEMYGINTEVSMETVEFFKYEIVNNVNKAMLSMGCPAEEGADAVTELLSKSTFQQFKEEFAKLLALLCEKEEENAYQEDVCRLAKRYVDEHFSDPMLTVAGVGEQMQITASYLSRMFRERYGVSILNYISETRIKSAKKALCEKKKSIYEIAEENGFLSSNVFIKAFKKQEGITPGAYRELENSKK